MFSEKTKIDLQNVPDEYTSSGKKCGCQLAFYPNIHKWQMVTKVYFFVTTTTHYTTNIYTIKVMNDEEKE